MGKKGCVYVSMYSVVFDPRNPNRVRFVPYKPPSPRTTAAKKKPKPKPNWLMKTLQDYANAQVRKYEALNRERRKKKNKT